MSTASIPIRLTPSIVAMARLGIHVTPGRGDSIPIKTISYMGEPILSRSTVVIPSSNTPESIRVT